MATPRQPRKPAGEPVEPGPPDPVVPQEQVAHPDQPAAMEENEITTMASLMNMPEIEVDSVQEPIAPPDANNMVVIRMNTTLEDFTFGNPYQHFKLEVGKRYRVPANIGHYLDGLGYVWH